VAQATANNAKEKVFVREAVGVFGDPESLQAALDDLALSGFRREEISVLAPQSRVREKLRAENPDLLTIMDHPDTPRAVFIPKEVMGEIMGSLMGVPLYLGASLGGALAIVEGAGWIYILAAIAAGGLAGMLLGGIVAWMAARWWNSHIRRQIRNGGLVLWVHIRSPDQESRAWHILSDNHARYLHVHDIPAG